MSKPRCPNCRLAMNKCYIRVGAKGVETTTPHYTCKQCWELQTIPTKRHTWEIVANNPQLEATDTATSTAPRISIMCPECNEQMMFTGGYEQLKDFMLSDKAVCQPIF